MPITNTFNITNEGLLDTNTTTSIGFISASDQATKTINLGSSYILKSVASSNSNIRIRLYNSGTNMNADSNRVISGELPQSHGLIYE
ncbi:hypothetical protein, partial [Atlanticothrix silvestris]|uniref:hypothetical protein n=1 Tax=Atlanticothrix silvestris TaxID=2840444 RepID=UPI001BDD392B